jgi:hypothetical protein
MYDNNAFATTKKSVDPILNMTDKESDISLSVLSVVDLASAKNNYMKEPDWMSSKISDGEVVRSAHGHQAGGGKKRSTLSH